MTPRDFCFWLQGYFEIGEIQGTTLSATQVATIKKHLNSVFEQPKPLEMPFKQEGQQLPGAVGDLFQKIGDRLIATGPKFEPPLTVTC